MDTKSSRSGTSSAADPVFADIVATIRAERRKQGQTQAELAGLSGVGVRFIVDLERGKPTVAFGLVLRVLRTLGISVQLEPRR